MPYYDFKCEFCSHEFEELCTFENKDTPCASECIECGKMTIQRIFTKPPKIGCSISLGIKKRDPNFTEMLKNIKKSNKHSTIDV